MGVAVGEAEIKPDMELAINLAKSMDDSMRWADDWPCIWPCKRCGIREEQREHAQKLLGYTVVDSSTVLATHLSQLLTNNASQLIGHEEVQTLLEMLSRSTPKLVEGFVPDQLPLGVLWKYYKTCWMKRIPPSRYPHYSPNFVGVFK